MPPSIENIILTFPESISQPRCSYLKAVCQNIFVFLVSYKGGGLRFPESNYHKIFKTF